MDATGSPAPPKPLSLPFGLSRTVLSNGGSVVVVVSGTVVVVVVVVVEVVVVAAGCSVAVSPSAAVGLASSGEEVVTPLS